jgi:hypothetical protein
VAGGAAYSIKLTVVPEAGSTGAAGPKGSVTIVDNGAAFAQNVALTQGTGVTGSTAQIAPAIGAGQHIFAVNYAGGDNNFTATTASQSPQPSQMASLTVGAAIAAKQGTTINPITLTFLNPGPAPMSSFGCFIASATAGTSLVGAPNFNGSIPGCTAQVSGTVAPGASGTITIVIPTAIRANAERSTEASSRLRRAWSLGLTMPAVVLVGGLAGAVRRRRIGKRMLVMIGLSLVVLCLLISIGCGSPNGFSNPTGTQPSGLSAGATPTGNYVITVYANGQINTPVAAVPLTVQLF